MKILYLEKGHIELLHLQCVFIWLEAKLVDNIILNMVYTERTFRHLFCHNNNSKMEIKYK